MAPPISKTSAEPTLYDILSLTPKHLERQASMTQQQKMVKQAYRRALLKHHPDKAANSKDDGASSPSPSSPAPKSSGSKSTKKESQPQPRIFYTVDQIQHAYSILSDHKQRSEYNRSLQTQSRGQSSSLSFQTGVETVDLDDLGFDERTGVYHRSCRCGNARGYAFTEENLEEFEDDGVLMVECLDCSLWIRVLFAAAEDEDDDVAVGSSNAGGDREEVVVTRSNANEVVGEGERRGSGTRRGIAFNWSLNWGISLSGSATAGANHSRR
ncbi:hypothetical protein F4819DRAFT_26157 [Hypoxylon fuscum]|nr:hypothetical protein F4819DRAFT_26157 [Hypoxylon fuscum]